MASLQDWIVQKVEAGDFLVEYLPLEIPMGDEVGTVFAFKDALKILHDGEFVRAMVSAATEQRLAYLLDCVLLTPLLADAIFAAANPILTPMLWAPLPPPTLESMVEQSRRIDAQLEELGGPGAGFVSTVGKHWVQSHKMTEKRGVNYAWHFYGPSYEGIRGSPSQTLPEARVLQPEAASHSKDYFDISQTCVLVHRTMRIGSEEHDIADVLRNPSLAHYLSTSGVMPLVAQPGVEELPRMASAPVPAGPGSSSGSSLAGWVAAAGAVALGGALVANSSKRRTTGDP